MSPYQPVIRDGKIIAEGERQCADRFEVIKELIGPLRGFSLLDIGAYTGYFSIRSRQEFGCKVTAIDDNADLHAQAGIDVINKRVSAEDLHFLRRHDVVLALSVLHHMPDWREALRWITICRDSAIIETCHPDERWMTKAAARHEVRDIYRTLTSLGSEVARFPRRGRDGKIHMRPLFLVPGTVASLTGTVFSGSGSCSRRLPEFGRGLDRRLGYTPFPGSLNLRLDDQQTNRILGKPEVPWVGRNGKRRRDYQFWSAWIGSYPCHVMIPGKRGWGPDSIEMVAPDKLRDRFGLQDGARITVDVRTNR